MTEREHVLENRLELTQDLGTELDGLCQFYRRKWKQRTATAKALWALLDDIDTLDDACREDDAAFRRAAMHLCKRRHEWASSYDGQTLVWDEEEDKT